ncbi:diguanylate cyclase (GGDEF) domain-containing protein [Bacillus sp. OK838]|nr:diguanylate cyclase (GGDEF) domain-containing protein [Bacillus sp. OK838]
MEEAYNDPSSPFERIHPDDYEILNEKIYSFSIIYSRNPMRILILRFPMILCDLDELKFMNDMYGHKKGDELIKEAANLLKRVFSDIAVVSRVGGDGFGILLLIEVREKWSHFVNY